MMPLVQKWPFNSVMIDAETVRVADSSDFTTRLLVTVDKVREVVLH